jgi:hypothetical protein
MVLLPVFFSDLIDPLALVEHLMSFEHDHNGLFVVVVVVFF